MSERAALHSTNHINGNLNASIVFIVQVHVTRSVNGVPEGDIQGIGPLKNHRV